MSLNLLDSRSVTTSPPGGDPARVPASVERFVEHLMSA